MRIMMNIILIIIKTVIDTSTTFIFNLLHKFKYKFFMSFSINKNEDCVISVRILATLFSVTSENSDSSETKYNLYYYG